MSDLIRRQHALEKTIRKYRGKPFVWGETDCVAMTRSHLVAMGHKKLPKPPKYSDAAGARRALKEMGHGSVAALLDAHLPRIRPAEALPGDLVLLQGTAGMGSVDLCLGQKLAGWIEGHKGFVTNIIPLEIEGAWRA